MQSIVFSKGRVNRKRIRCCFLLLLLYSIGAKAQTISVTLKEAPMEQAFKTIEAQTSYRFIYSKEAISKARPVTLTLADVPMADVLLRLFSGQPLTYSLEDNYVIVKPKPANNDAGLLNITGRVTDEAGNALAGVNVQVKGSVSKGTITSEDGSYHLEDVAPGSVLVFSFVGRQTQEISVSGRTTVTLRLNTVSKQLDETIIQAYGTTTRRLATGNISKVTGEQISRQAILNPLAALGGRVPGMVVTQSSGVAGSSFRVQVRGRTTIDPSITDDQPLFIVDGVPFAPNNNYLNTMVSALGTPFNSNGTLRPGGLSPFASLNPEDIESIEVLKDADATAIYGSRGANGVVLITTKRGKAGKTKFDFSIQEGVGSPTRIMRMMNTSEYLRMRHEAFFNDSMANPMAGVKPTNFNAYDLLLWDTTRYTDLAKLLLGGKAHMFDAQASVSGGNANTQFLFGGGYRRETSVFYGSPEFGQSSVHLNLSHATDDRRFKLTISGNYSSAVTDSYAADLASLLDLPPNILLRDSSGNLGWNEKGLMSGWNNPLALVNARYSTQTDNLVTNLMIDYRLAKGLTARVSSGYNTVALNEQSISPLSSQNPLQNSGRSASFANRSFKSYVIEPRIEYENRGRLAKVEGLLGGTWQYQRTGLISSTGSGYVDDALLNSLAGATSVTATRNETDYKYEAVFARGTYTWRSRYIVNLSARRDGSSRFGPARQFANFGAVGAAWIFSNENFLKNVSFLSFGKFRGSAGITGNDKIADYLYLDTWKPAQNTYQGGTALLPSKLFNPDYRWEKTKKLEAALDLGFLRDRLLFSAAYYRNRSSNQLINVKLPAATGFTGIVQNLDAMVQNSGTELTLSYNSEKGNKLQWEASVNITIPRTQLVRFPGLSSSSYATTYVVGQPLNLIYAYRSLGIDPASGLYLIQDKNKDSNLNNSDKQALGSLDPKWYGGISNSISFGKFRLDALVQFTKQTGVGFWGSFGNVPGSIRNMPAILLPNSPTGETANNEQRFTQSTSTLQSAYLAYSQFRQSNGIYDDASFIRLKTLILSYYLADKLLKRMGLGRASLYFSAQNLLTITNYKGGDPEVQNYLRMPPLKTLAAGIQFSF